MTTEHHISLIHASLDCGLAPNDERELMDLLGAKVEGLPAGKRYPLSDDWPTDEYPLRKDWKKKEGVKTNA